MDMKENWKKIKGYEDLYMVSDRGRVKSLDRVVVDTKGRTQSFKGRIIAQTITTTGYYRVTLKRAGTKPYHIKTHQLVAQAFLNHTIDGHKVVVDHIDENKLNNELSNLQLLSNRENVIKSWAYKKANGIKQREHSKG